MRERQLIIGVAGPFSGPRSAFGDLLKKSCARASSSADLKIIFQDDQADASQARKVAREFIGRGADVIIGHFNSECAHAAGELYEVAGIPLLLPAATHPGLTNNRVTYRLCASDLKQIRAIAGEIAMEHDGTVAIWNDCSAYGERLRELLKSAVPGLRDVSAARASVDGPALVACFGAYHRVAAFIRTIAAHRPDARFICADDCAITAFADDLHQLRGIRVAMPVPGFAKCVESAFELIEQFLSEGDGDLCGWLDQTGKFVAREACSAQFQVEPLETICGQDRPTISAA